MDLPLVGKRDFQLEIFCLNPCGGGLWLSPSRPAGAHEDVLSDVCVGPSVPAADARWSFVWEQRQWPLRRRPEPPDTQPQPLLLGSASFSRGGSLTDLSLLIWCRALHRAWGLGPPLPPAGIRGQRGQQCRPSVMWNLMGWC